MKKFFTLITATLMAAGAYAQTLWAPDKSTNVGANQTYVDDDVLKVESTFASTLKGVEATFGDLKFTHYIQVRSKTDPSATEPLGSDNGGSTTLIITPKSDLTFTAFYRRQSTSQVENKGVYASNDGKDMKAYDQKENSVIDGTMTLLSETEDGKYGYVTKEYELKAGKSYTLWGRGTTICFYGFQYEATQSGGESTDCTSYIVNADLTGNDGWNIEGTKGYHSVGGVVTAGNNAQFNFCQTIKDLPAGQYKLTAQAAYRFSSSEADEATAIAAGTDTKLATLYATVGTKTVSEKVMNRWDGASDTDYANNNGSTTVNGKFVPNSTAAMKAWFTNGQYVNEVVFNLTEDGDVTIGIEKTAQPDAGDYTVIGPWTLTRLGDAEQVAEPITVTFDFSDPNFRKDIGEDMTDTKGYIYNETFPVDDVELQITAGSAPSRIFVDKNRGQNLVTYKEYTTLTFRAPEGKAITEIEFVAAGNSNINNFTASSGTIEGMKWTGNADGVRFHQGGTSYLAKAIVKLEDKTDETEALLAMPYVACENIAAFNALDNGTYAKVMLEDAELTGISADGYSTMWIQDATGGCWIQYTTLINKLKEGNKVNGFFYVVKRTASGNTQMKEAEDTPESEFTLEPISSYTMVEGTIAEVNVAANLSRVVKITNAEFAATSATQGKLTQGEASITVNNGTETANQQMHKITDVWVKDETMMADVTIVAILAANSATDATKNQLYPISMEGTVVTGIQTVEAAAAEKYTIFNLQGQRMEQVQKGLYIVNGKKVVLK